MPLPHSNQLDYRIGGGVRIVVAIATTNIQPHAYLLVWFIPWNVITVNMEGRQCVYRNSEFYTHPIVFIKIIIVFIIL